MHFRKRAPARSNCWPCLALNARGNCQIRTISEFGYPACQTLTWNGLVAPANTPKDTIDRLEEAITRAIKEPKVIEQLNVKGIDPVGSSSTEFSNTITKDIKFWQEVVDIADVKEK
jgi:tripartite-type tricarboxylate transporter receptor subunit TctC